MLEAVGSEQAGLPPALLRGGRHVGFGRDRGEIEERNGESTRRGRNRGQGEKRDEEPGTVNESGRHDRNYRPPGGKLEARKVPAGTGLTRDEAQRLLTEHRWPDGLEAVMRRLRADGHAAWLVGGTVRDVLLHRSGGERVDVATDHTPEAVTALFARVIPTGWRH